MGKKSHPALIGAFVVGAVALAVVAIIVWGKGRLFEKVHTYVAYFPGSVNGLTIGAPVKIRGVQIGEVTDIRLRYRQERGAPRIPVFFKVDDRRVRELGALQAPTAEVVQEFVQQGWRARLQTLSIVTGVLYIEFDLLPGTRIDLVQAADAEYPEVPTAHTAFEEATASLSKVLADLHAIDFEGIGKGVNTTLTRLNQVLERPELDAAIEELPKTLASARRLVTNLDARTEPLIASLQRTSDETRRGVDSLRATLDGVHGLLEPDAPLSVELMQTVGSLGQAASALRDLADYLERNPNAVVFGRARAR